MQKTFTKNYKLILCVPVLCSGCIRQLFVGGGISVFIHCMLMDNSIPNYKDRTPMEEENQLCKPALPARPKADAIALLFLTVGEIRNSDIWAAWLKPVNPDLYSIYVHAKVKYHIDNVCS